MNDWKRLNEALERLKIEILRGMLAPIYRTLRFRKTAISLGERANRIEGRNNIVMKDIEIKEWWWCEEAQRWSDCPGPCPDGTSHHPERKRMIWARVMRPRKIGEMK